MSAEPVAPGPAQDEAPRLPGEDLEHDQGLTRVRHALADSGAEGQVEVLPRCPRDVVDLAGLLGVGPGSVLAPLLLTSRHRASTGGRRVVLVLAPASHAVDVDQVAAVLGCHDLRPTPPEEVPALTGYAAQALPPVGHLLPLETLVDVTLAGADVVWASAGHPRAVFPTRYEELVRITLGRPAELT